MRRFPVFKSMSLFILAVLIMACNQTQNEDENNRPNILFCIADDATFMHMGAYGCSWVNTPAFDKIAKQGLLFTNAYTPNAKCAPSRSCIVTGRNSWQLEQAGNHWSFFPTKFKTYAEALGENGYHVGYTAKGLAPVIALTEDGKPRPVLGKQYSEIKLVPPTTKISNIDYAANFQEFLKQKPEDAPFLFWYGATEPHRRYEYGSGIKKGNKSLDDIDEVYPFWPDKESVRTDMLDYAFEIEYFDSHLEKILAELEKNGELENTIVIATSDNGMPFPRVKGQAYEYSNHLPLAIMWKNGIKSPGRVIEDFVSFIDFAPTFLELADVDQKTSGMKTIEGNSLTEIFESNKSGIVSSDRNHVLIGKERHDVGRPNDQGYPIRGIRKGDYLLLINFETERWPSGNPETGYLNCDGGATKTQILNDRRIEEENMYWDYCFAKRTDKELYNVKKDPGCIKNLIGESDYKELGMKLEAQLLEELKSQGDPRVFGNGSVFDKYIYANKADRNFHQRHIAGENTKAGWVNKTDFEEKSFK